MEGNENCIKCNQPAENDEVYTCDSCLSWIHRNCLNLSASEARCMPLQKRVLMFICDSCKGLLARMPYMVEMLQQIKRDVEDLKKGSTTACGTASGRSFSDALKAGDDRINNRTPNLPTLIIKPKIGQSAEKTRKDIQGGIDPTQLKVGIKNLKNTKNGSVLIKCANKGDIELVRQAAKDGLGESYSVETSKLKLPRVKIVSYTGKKTVKEIEKCLREQNDWITVEDTLNIQHVRKIERKNCSTIFADCSPELYFKMMQFKKVCIEWERCPVYEDLNVTRCFKCQGYYHKSNACDRKKVCGKCAGEHEEGVCQSQERKCFNCMMANNRFKMNYPTDHAATDHNCPSTKYHIDRLKSRIDYGS